MIFHFAKPSVRRLMWSLVAVAVVSCLIAGIGLAIGSVRVGYESIVPASTGDYVRLIVLCLTFWGPVFVLTAWPFSLPTILALGALAACVRRNPSPDKSSEFPFQGGFPAVGTGR